MTTTNNKNKDNTEDSDEAQFKEIYLSIMKVLANYQEISINKGWDERRIFFSSFDVLSFVMFNIICTSLVCPEDAVDRLVDMIRSKLKMGINEFSKFKYTMQGESNEIH
jgi:hypothetical protein